jgi:hypothetical protein
VKIIKVFIACFILSGIFYFSCDEDSSEDLLRPPTNNSPVIQDQADTSATMGDTLKLLAIAHDIDGDTITYQYVAWYSLSEIRLNYQVDAEMNAENGHFWFYPQNQDKPDRLFGFVAIDPFGGSDTTKFNITVAD